MMLFLKDIFKISSKNFRKFNYCRWVYICACLMNKMCFQTFFKQSSANMCRYRLSAIEYYNKLNLSFVVKQVVLLYLSYKDV